MAQTKADRQAAAKKAAATRKRNEVRAKSQAQGKKAASSRQQNEARDSLTDAKRAARGAVGGVTSAAKLVGKAAVQAGKSVGNRTPGKH